MLRIKFTTDKRRWIAAGVYAVVAIVLFIVFPGVLSASIFALPMPLALLAPTLVLVALACLLLVVRQAHMAIRLTLKLLAVCICVFMLMYAVELLGGGDLLALMQANAYAFLFGCFLLLALLAFFYGITGRLHWALRITAALALLYGYINYFTLQFRGTPLVPEDVFAVGTALAVLPNYSFAFTQQLAETILIFAAIFCIAGKVRLPDMKRRLRFFARGAALVLPLVFLVSTVTKKGFVAHELNPYYWDQAVSAKANGSLVNFVANIPDMIITAPENYTPEAAQEIAVRYPSGAVRDAEVKPDVILIMGESWADIANEEYVKTNTPAMPFLSSFRNRADGIYRKLLVSTSGGGTSRSEFQVLTGTSVEYGLHHAPFQFNVGEGVPNIVESFKRLGYSTTAMHTGRLDAWGRDEALPILGFDTFIDHTDIAEPDSKKLRYYLSDEAMYKKALSILDKSDQPQFIYAITIQTHGGYEHEGYQSPIQIIEPEGGYAQTEQFLGLLRESDKDFQFLIEELEKRERPAIVLAYGDHLPLVEDAYMDAAQAAWHENYSSYSSQIWKYETFYVMWANFPLPDAVKNQPPYASLNYLGAYLMVGAGLPLTGYQKFLLEGASRFPAVSVVGYIDPKGNYLDLWDVRQTELYAQQAILQYNLIKDRENYPPNFFSLR